MFKIIKDIDNIINCKQSYKIENYNIIIHGVCEHFDSSGRWIIGTLKNNNLNGIHIWFD